MKSVAEDRLREIVEPLARSKDLEVWGIEMLPSPGRQLIRIYIDAEGGVDVEHCASLSRALGVALEVEDVIPGAYTLEVSSPGLDRPFFELGQMRPHVGETVDARLTEPLGDRKHFRGTLTAVGETNFTLEVDGAPVTLDWDTVKKAHLVYHFPEPSRPGHPERS